MNGPKVTPEELRQSYQLPDDDEELLAECSVTMFKSSGPGGQHRNKTMSSVRLFHRPSGVVVIGRRERSQKRNLDDALTRLRERLRRMLEPPKARRKTRPSRASREKVREEKTKKSRLKRERAGRNWE